jgi:hypothetical protein
VPVKLSDQAGPRLALPKAEDYRHSPLATERCPRRKVLLQKKPTFNKRNKERARQEKQRDKEASKVARRNVTPNRASGAPGEDPDLVGIVAGPQPPLE